MNRTPLTYAPLFLLALAGCSQQQQQIRLRQPSAPGAQQDITLKSDWTFTRGAGDRRQCVLSFPLPGAKGGPRDFHVYLSLPDRPGKHTVDAEPGGAGARGFLIQAVGERKGKATFAEGSARLRRSWMTMNKLMLDLSVVCTDGTGISGSVRLEEKPEEVRGFTRRYGADIGALEPATAESKPALTPREPIMSDPK